MTIQPLNASPLDQIIDDFKTILSDSSTGSTQNQPFAFGSVRLLACPGGLKDTSVLTAGIQFTLRNGWSLKHPSIQAFAPNADVTLLTPLKEDEQGNGWANNYTGSVFFPILFSFSTPPKQQTTISVVAYVMACSEIGICQRETIVQSLPLSIEHNRTTPWCAYIQSTLSSTAVPSHVKNVTGNAIKLNEKQWLATISFPNKVKFVKGQTADGTSELSSIILGKEARLTFPITDSFPNVGDTIPLFLKTSDFFYQVDLPITDAPIQQPGKPFPWFSSIFGGFLLFLLSPLWSLWLTNTKKTLPAIRQTILAQIRQLFPIIIIAGTLTTTGVLGFLSNFLIFNIVLLILLLLFLIRPLPSFTILSLGLILLPKPFWQDAVSYNTPAVIFVWVFWAIGALLPFWFKSRFSIKGQTFFHTLTLSQTPIYAVFKRLPFILIGSWLSIQLIFQTFFAQPTFSQDMPLTQPTLISITAPHCWSCTWDQSILFNSPTAQRILTHHNVRTTSLPIDSPLVNKIAPDLPKGMLPAHVLVLPEGYHFIWTQNFTPKKLEYFLNNHLENK